MSLLVPIIDSLPHLTLLPLCTRLVTNPNVDINAQQPDTIATTVIEYYSYIFVWLFFTLFFKSSEQDELQGFGLH